MMSHSPTAMDTYERCCPKAVEHYKKSRHMDSEYEIEGPLLAESGIVFHSCVHQYALALKEGRDPAAALDATATALTTKMTPTLVKEAADHARDFCDWWEFPLQFEFEHGVAWDKQWNRVKWDDPNRRLRLILDSIGVVTVEEEDTNMKIAIAQDYKTGWGASKDELDSIQMDAYVATLFELYGQEVDAIQIEIISTRRRRVFEKILILNDQEHFAEIEARKARLEFLMTSIEASDFRPVVGAGCINCRFAPQCDAFNDRAEFLKGHGYVMTTIEDDPEQAARDLAVLERKANDIKSILKERCKIHGFMDIDNYILGHHDAEVREVNSYGSLWTIFSESIPDMEWTDDQMNIIRTFLTMMKPGATQLANVVKKCARQLGFKSQKQALSVMEPKFITPKHFTKFGWKKKPKEAKR